jgi:hypothetical protein
MKENRRAAAALGNELSARLQPRAQARRGVDKGAISEIIRGTRLGDGDRTGGEPKDGCRF